MVPFFDENLPHLLSEEETSIKERRLTMLEASKMLNTLSLFDREICNKCPNYLQ